MTKKRGSAIMEIADPREPTKRTRLLESWRGKFITTYQKTEYFKNWMKRLHQVSFRKILKGTKRNLVPEHAGGHARITSGKGKLSISGKTYTATTVCSVVLQGMQCAWRLMLSVSIAGIGNSQCTI
jgi:hypothetical protein